MAVSLSYAVVPREALPPSIARFAGEQVTSMPPFLYIDLVVQPILRGIADTSTLLLKEEEVTGEFFGDFTFQFPPETGHNPMGTPIYLREIYDRIGFALDTNQPCNEGRARWNIPVVLTDSRTPLYRDSINVIQEYVLHNHILTVRKGDTVLLECPVPKPQPQEDL